jgi:hydroxymethylbilane synthase
MVSDLTGERIIRREAEGPAGEAFRIGLDMAREVLAAGGKAILDEIYAANTEAPSGSS